MKTPIQWNPYTNSSNSIADYHNCTNDTVYIKKDIFNFKTNWKAGRIAKNDKYNAQYFG